MKRQIGLWIDHKQAIIVFIEDGKERIEVIESHVERHVRLSGGARSVTPYGPQDIVSESRRDEKYKHHLGSYYHEVIQVIRDAHAILICGPGEAKIELKKAIEKSKEIQKRVVEIETVDKMTQRQIAAKVREYFTQ